MTLIACLFYFFFICIFLFISYITFFVIKILNNMFCAARVALCVKFRILCDKEFHDFYMSLSTVRVVCCLIWETRNVCWILVLKSLGVLKRWQKNNMSINIDLTEINSEVRRVITSQWIWYWQHWTFRLYCQRYKISYIMYYIYQERIFCQAYPWKVQLECCLEMLLPL